MPQKQPAPNVAVSVMGFPLFVDNAELFSQKN
jgi:hypothetical protein